MAAVTLTQLTQTVYRKNIPEAVGAAVRHRNEKVRRATLLSILEAANPLDKSIPATPLWDQIRAFATVPVEAERVMLLSKIYENNKHNFRMTKKQHDDLIGSGVPPEKILATITEENIFNLKHSGVSSRDISLILLGCNEAFNVMKLMKFWDPQEKVDALCPISRHLMLCVAHVENLRKDRNVSNLFSAMKMPNPEATLVEIRGCVTGEVPYRNAEQMAFQELIDAAKAIENKKERASVLMDISKYFRESILKTINIDSADPEGAVVAVERAVIETVRRTIPDVEIRWRMIAHSFEALLKASRVNEALELAGTLSLEEQPGAAYLYISQTLKARAKIYFENELEESLETVTHHLMETAHLAKKIPIQHMRDPLLLVISNYLRQIGKSEEAARVADTQTFCSPETK